MRRVARVVSAALFLAASAASVARAGPPIYEATDEQKKAAQTTFVEASAKAKAGKHEEALAGFRASHEIVASPNSRFMIARELMELGRLGEAYREALAAERLAEDAAKADKKYESTLQQARREVANLKAKVGFVRLDPKGRPDGEVVVEGRSILGEELGGPIAVNPGKVEVVIRRTGRQETRTVDVAAGAEATVSFAPPAAPPPEPREEEYVADLHPFDGGDGQRIAAVACGGVGVVGMVLFGVFGGLNVSQFRELRDSCPQNRCPASLEDDAERGRAYQTAANVSVTIGAVALAAGAALFIPTIVGDVKPSRIFVAVGPGELGLRGVFE